MAAEVTSKTISQSNQLSVNLLSGFFILTGLGAIIGFVFAVLTSPALIAAQDTAFGNQLLAFMNNFGIVLPVLVIGLGVFFIRLAVQIYQMEYQAAAWARLLLFWLMILSIIVLFVVIFDSISGTGARAWVLPVVIACIAIGAACAFGWSWLGENMEDVFQGGETITSRESRLAWNLLIPTLFVLVLVAARPLERTFIASLTNQEFAGVRETRFVGLDNYARLLGFRIDGLSCVTTDAGECEIREVTQQATETQEVIVDGEAVRSVLQRLSDGQAVSGVPNLLNPLGQPELIQAAVADETGETAAQLAWYDGERIATTLLQGILNATRPAGSPAISSIVSVEEGVVMAVVTTTTTRTETVYPNVREVAGPDYNRLGFSPISTFNLFGQRYVFSGRDATFVLAFGNTLFFTVMSVVLELVLGMAIALVVNSKFPGRGLMRAAMLVPWAIPTVVSARLWEVMLRDNQSGVINHFLMNTGLIDRPLAWLANTDLQIWSLIFVDVWKTTPFMALLLLAGLQTIPSDIYEAADVDGANKFRQFFSLTLPLLRPTIAVALVFRTLDAIRAFDVFDVLIGKQLQSLATYNQFVLVENQQFGYASAVGVTIFIIILIFTVVYVRSIGVDAE